MAPSAKLVYTVLTHRGPQTQKQLIEESMLSPRTVRYALTDLSDTGIVTETVYLPDARQSLYELTDDASRSQHSTAEAGASACASAPSND